MISLPLENVVKYTKQLIHVGKLDIIYSHHIYKENFMTGMKRKLKAIYKACTVTKGQFLLSFTTSTLSLVSLLPSCRDAIFSFFLHFRVFFFFFSGSVGIVRRNCCGELFIGFSYWSSASGISHFGML